MYCLSHVSMTTWACRVVVNPLRVKHIATQRAVESLVVAILPRRSWIDADGLQTDTPKPILEERGRERVIVIKL